MAANLPAATEKKKARGPGPTVDLRSQSWGVVPAGGRSATGSSVVSALAVDLEKRGVLGAQWQSVPRHGARPHWQRVVQIDEFLAPLAAQQRLCSGTGSGLPTLVETYGDNVYAPLE